MSEVRVNDRTTPFWCVYFVRSQETGLVKVGRTQNLGQRITQLTAEMGQKPLTLLCCIPTFNPALETEFLKILAPFCVEGSEWFRVREKDLYDTIAEVLRGFRHWSEVAPAKYRVRATV